MTLTDLRKQGRLTDHQTAPAEIANLFAGARRDMADARVEDLSLDRRFTIAYSAALSLATAALYARGFRSAGFGHHATVFAALPDVMGESMSDLADYFDLCRRKRNRLSYERVGLATEADVEELTETTEQFAKQVREWFRENHPDLLSNTE